MRILNQRTVAFIVVGGALAALLIGGALVVGQQQTRSDVAEVSSAPTASTAAPGASSPEAASTSTAEPTPEASTPTPGAPSPGTPDQLPPAEVPPPATGDSLRLPSSTPLPDLITSPLPATASATGKIVHGFPTDLIPTAPHSTVVSSSVASEGPHLQAALTAKSTLSTTEVLAYYRTAFAPFGLLDSPAPAAGGSSALIFTRGTDSVTLTVTGVSGGSRYIVFGALTAPH
ncbi:MAG: hypothetical protein ABIO33_01280 [Leifsonia sp.]